MLNRSTKMEEDIMDMWKASSETVLVDFSTKMADTTKVCGETTQWMAKEFLTTKTVELPMTANGTRANFMEKVKSTTIMWRKWLITLIIGILTQTLITTGNIIKVIFLIWRRTVSWHQSWIRQDFHVQWRVFWGDFQSG